MTGLVLLLAATAWAQDPEPVDPHEAADGCTHCHEAGPTATEPGPALPSIEACSVCHPSAEEDMHVVGLVPSQAPPPATWPLEDGAIACATCHAEPACDASRPQELPYLRDGPYPDPDQMCWACHDSAGFERSDPHHPEVLRAVDDATCAACHTSVPDEGAVFADAKLRAEDKVCATCHEGTLHQGMDSHLGKTVEALDDASRAVVTLAEGDTVACWSCHEVHTQGATRPSKAERPFADALRALALENEWQGQVPEGTRWAGEDREHSAMLALPLEDGALCKACHGVGP